MKIITYEQLMHEVSVLSLTLIVWIMIPGVTHVYDSIRYTPVIEQSYKCPEYTEPRTYFMTETHFITETDTLEWFYHRDSGYYAIIKDKWD